MCGVAGQIKMPDGFDFQGVIKAKQMLGHRGPDGCGDLIIRSHVGIAHFAHTRLSILDITEAGAQPMSVHCEKTGGKLSITFNGEIYNFMELKSELNSLGYSFRTQTDTEVILRAYEAWGLECLHKLRGMFAFALADPSKEIVLLARDRFGIKPLYLSSPPSGGLVFASEIRALQGILGGNAKKKINQDSIHSFLAQGMIIGPETLVEGIRELEPGSFLIVDFSGNKVHSGGYVKTCPEGWIRGSRSDSVLRLRPCLQEAIRLHLIADVPVGIFLSSGIDSSAITALASEAHSDLRTISIGFDQPESDESGNAQIIAKYLGTKHQTIRLVGVDVMRQMDAVFAAIDQPTVDGFNTFFVARAAKTVGLKVALSGLGGDEVFGGYASFRDVPRAEKYRSFLSNRLVIRLVQLLNGIVRKRSLWKMSRVQEYTPALVGMYLLRRELFSGVDRLALLGPVSGRLDPLMGVSKNMVSQWEAMIFGRDPENAVSALEQSIYMRNMLLRDSDVFSMANGLEIRVPLLDHEVVSMVDPMPGYWKRPGKNAKALLVDAVGARFPQGARNRRKQGFSFPWAAWLRGPMRKMSMDRLRLESWKNLGIDSKAVDGIWNRFEQKDPSVTALHIIALMVLADVQQRQQLTA